MRLASGDVEDVKIIHKRGEFVSMSRPAYQRQDRAEFGVLPRGLRGKKFSEQVRSIAWLKDPPDLNGAVGQSQRQLSALRGKYRATESAG